MVHIISVLLCICLLVYLDFALKKINDSTLGSGMQSGLPQPAQSKFYPINIVMHLALNYVLELMINVLDLSTNRSRFCRTHLVRMCICLPLGWNSRIRCTW
jgi:hypothetical protein